MTNNNLLNVANIKLVSLNVKGLGNRLKRLAIFSYLKGKKADISFLQETHSDLCSEQTWRKDWDGSMVYCHGTSNSKGVMILFSKDIQLKINEIKTLDGGRFLLVNCDINDKNYVLCCIYAPTKDKQNEQLQFLESCMNILVDCQGTNLILAGDFNTYLNPEIDKIGGTQKANSKYTDILLDLIEELDLVDIWCIRHVDKKRYTFRQKTKSGLVQCRLDYFLISKPLEYSVISACIEPSIKTDHSLVSIMINCCTEQTRGKGVWKFNANLLLDNTYVAFA